MRVETGGTPYAVGYPERGFFRTRCIRFGKLAASYERRPGEEIRAVIMFRVAEKKSRPSKIETAE